MKTGIITCSYVLEISNYQHLPWPELVELHHRNFGPEQLDALFARIAGLGFSHVELWAEQAGNSGRTPLWRGTPPGRIGDMARRHGLTIASYCPGGVDREECLDEICAFARGMGVGMLTGWVGRDPAFPAVLARYLDRHGLIYGIEPHGPSYALCTPDEILTAAAASERFGVCPDTGIWAAEGIMPAEALVKVLPRVVHTHLKGRRLDRGTDCAPGRDDIGLDRVVRMLHESGYGGVYSLEYEADHDPDPDLRQSLAWLTGILEGRVRKKASR